MKPCPKCLGNLEEYYSGPTVSVVCTRCGYDDTLENWMKYCTRNMVFAIGRIDTVDRMESCIKRQMRMLMDL